MTGRRGAVRESDVLAGGSPGRVVEIALAPSYSLCRVSATSTLLPGWGLGRCRCLLGVSDPWTTNLSLESVSIGEICAVMLSLMPCQYQCVPISAGTHCPLTCPLSRYRRYPFVSVPVLPRWDLRKFEWCVARRALLRKGRDVYMKVAFC
jgi:hypothetical protein